MTELPGERERDEPCPVKSASHAQLGLEGETVGILFIC